jgi:hypothetical protein
MGFCLRSDYYFDDHMFVVNPTETADADVSMTVFGHRLGGTETATWKVGLGALIPYLQTRVAHHLTGLSPLWDHAWNLSFHLIMALLVFATAKRFLAVAGFDLDESAQQTAAFWTAILFACHPLGTEPVNYAKCTYMQMVALEALSMCWAVLHYRQKSGIVRFLLTAFGILGIASLTYPYALPITLSTGGILLFFTMGSKKVDRRGKPSAPAIFAGTALVAFLGFVVVGTLRWWIWHLSVSHHSAVSQLLTQARVFWEYAIRMVIPTHLCSDHSIPWSLGWSDSGGVVALISLG